MTFITMAKTTRNTRPRTSAKAKTINIVRVPKDQCPYCEEKFNISSNGYDIAHRGTLREKQIKRYLCRSCGKTYQERNYISPSRLMARQAGILWLQGYDYKTIAKMLNIEATTAQSYVTKILNHEEAMLVRKTESEETPITENKFTLEISMLKKWSEANDEH